MATLEDILPKLTRLTPKDLDLVGSLIDHVLGVDIKLGPQADDAEMWWGEITGDNAWKHTAAEPLWLELGELQKEPSKNFRRITELKKRLRLLGEL